MINLPTSLKNIEFSYVRGISGDWGAERVYQNKEHGIQRNLFTPKKRGVWGTGEYSFSIIGSKKFYDSYEELVEAIRKDS